jgi:hypothetical protein
MANFVMIEMPNGEKRYVNFDQVDMLRGLANGTTTIRFEKDDTMTVATGINEILKQMKR